MSKRNQILLRARVAILVHWDNPASARKRSQAQRVQRLLRLNEQG